MRDDLKDLHIRFKQVLDKIEWFIILYFGRKILNKLIEYADNKDNSKLYSSLNKIWFELPDSKFNIIENPPGWREFLSLVEVD